MPAMVVINDEAEKRPEPTFFLFTWKKDGFRLRDYSNPKGTKPVEVRRQAPPEWTVERVRRWAKRLDKKNFYFEVPEHKYTDYKYWHAQTVEYNDRYLTPRPPPPPPPPPPPNRTKWWVEIIVGVVIVVIGAIVTWLLRLNK